MQLIDSQISHGASCEMWEQPGHTIQQLETTLGLRILISELAQCTVHNLPRLYKLTSHYTRIICYHHKLLFLVMPDGVFQASPGPESVGVVMQWENCQVLLENMFTTYVFKQVLIN